MLLIGGRMIVGEIVSRAELVRRRKDDRFYDAAEWIIAKPDSGTRLDLHRALDSELTRGLRFVSRKSQPKSLFFASDAKLDGQTTRGVRELTPESAKVLDRIITITDRPCAALYLNEVDYRGTTGKRGTGRIKHWELSKSFFVRRTDLSFSAQGPSYRTSGRFRFLLVQMQGAIRQLIPGGPTSPAFNARRRNPGHTGALTCAMWLPIHHLVWATSNFEAD
jgi:hypothetical protein